jgi:hypothetical protein
MVADLVHSKLENVRAFLSSFYQSHFKAPSKLGPFFKTGNNEWSEYGFEFNFTITLLKNIFN